MTPKLSSLTPQEKIKLAAELDGWSDLGPKEHWRFVRGHEMRRAGDFNWDSYDAIIPLLQKQSPEIRAEMFEKTNGRVTIMTTPSQLLDALLIATGKATI